jgi:hypothetical protein
MARMTLLTLIVLLLGGGAPLRAQEAKPERFGPGGFRFTPPAAVEVQHRAEWGMSATNIEVRPGFYLDVLTYSWWAHYTLGTPATAQDYLRSLMGRAGDDFRVVDPPTRIEFQGYPAWTLTRAYTIKQRLNRGEFHAKESYLLIQRRWGYVVVEYSNDAEFYDQDLSKYQAFLIGLELLPEPPGGSWLLVVLMAALAAIGGWFYRRRIGKSHP